MFPFLANNINTHIQPYKAKGQAIRHPGVNTLPEFFIDIIFFAASGVGNSTIFNSNRGGKLDPGDCFFDKDGDCDGDLDHPDQSGWSRS